MKRAQLLIALFAFITVIVMIAALRSKEGITEKQCQAHGGTYLNLLGGTANYCLKWDTNETECEKNKGVWWRGSGFLDKIIKSIPASKLNSPVCQYYS